MSEVWADRDRRRRCTPVVVAAAFAGIGGEFFRAFRYLVLSSTWGHAAHRITFLPRVTIPCKLLDWGWIKNAVNLHDADPLIDQLEMKKVEKEDSIGLAEPKRSKVERTANKLTTARPSNARSTMAKPRTTRFRPKNRTRSFTFYEMTERHIIHSKFQWRTSQLDQRRSRLVLDTYGEGTFRWSFRTSKGQRRTMPKRLFQNCLLENKVNVVVPDGPEPINEGGVGLAEESESSHLSRLLSSDGKDKAPISTDQTNFEAQPVQTIRRLRMQSAPTSSFRAARPRISDEIIKPDVKAIIKHGSVHSQSVVIVRAQDSCDEKIAEEEAVCKLCFNGFNDGNVLKTVCRCTKIALIHEDCAAKWSTEHGNNCDFCEGEIQNIPITLLQGPSSTKKEVGQECKKLRWFSPLRRTWQYLKSFK